MPSLSGVDLIRSLRTGGSDLPVLLLTARDTAGDRVSGLDAGADDYLVKPFDFGELLARIRALLRRPPAVVGPLLQVGDVELDPAQREVHVGGRSVALTGTEWSILEILARRSPAVVGRRSIAVQVWDDEADAVASNTIDVHVARLRSKLAGARARLETVRGVGYRLLPA
jgi:DNA-binding response OmpR family regulator